MEMFKRAVRVGIVVLCGVGLAACGGPEPPELPDAPEEITRKLVLVNAGADPERASAALRDAAGLSAEQARELLESLPGVVATGLSHERAAALAEKLRVAGMTTEIRRE